MITRVIEACDRQSGQDLGQRLQIHSLRNCNRNSRLEAGSAQDTRLVPTRTHFDGLWLPATMYEPTMLHEEPLDVQTRKIYNSFRWKRFVRFRGWSLECNCLINVLCTPGVAGRYIREVAR